MGWQKEGSSLTCFGWPFFPPMVVVIMCPVSVPLPSTTAASISCMATTDVFIHHIDNLQRPQGRRALTSKEVTADLLIVMCIIAKVHISHFSW